MDSNIIVPLDKVSLYLAERDEEKQASQIAIKNTPTVSSQELELERQKKRTIRRTI